MFVGSGKRGSHNHKRRGGASKIVSVMKSNENGMYSLGCIRMETPLKKEINRRLRNATARINTAFFVTKLK